MESWISPVGKGDIGWFEECFSGSINLACKGVRATLAFAIQVTHTFGLGVPPNLVTSYYWRV